METCRLLTIRFQRRRKKKKEPTKRSRANKKQDVVHEAAEPPAKIYKEAR